MECIKEVKALVSLPVPRFLKPSFFEQLADPLLMCVQEGQRVLV